MINNGQPQRATTKKAFVKPCSGFEGFFTTNPILGASSSHDEWVPGSDSAKGSKSRVRTGKGPLPGRSVRLVLGGIVR